MKKTPADPDRGELRREYHLDELSGGVRGKYLDRARAGSNIICIEPDLASAFPDSASVNRALRMLRDAAAAIAVTPRRRSRRRSR